MSSDLLFLVGGLALLLGVVLPAALSRAALSAPIVLLGAGVLIGLLPMPGDVVVSPLEHPTATEHLTEVCVIVSLMGVGLSLDRTLDVRRLSSWRRWSSTWRLLALGIPLTVALVALSSSWLLGLAPAAAVLLGAALSPTDPVLASDVQVAGPTEQDPDDDGPGSDESGGDESARDEDVVDEDDEVRVALTSEAGLNDGLGFPFVNLAVLLATAGAAGVAGTDLLTWFAWDLVGRIVIGVVVGGATGWVLARVAFRAPRRSLRLAETGEPLLALAATFLAYGLAEVAHGYGFLAVFCCALGLRSAERGHGYHADMHAVVERLERLLTLVVLLLLGVALTQGLLGRLTWQGALVGVLLVLVVRPVVGWLVLHPSMPARPERVPGRLRPRERLAVAFFGVRGVGTLYYLAYGLSHGDFGDPGPLWSTVAFAVVLSVVVHGVSATPVMRALDDLRAPARRA